MGQTTKTSFTWVISGFWVCLLASHVKLDIHCFGCTFLCRMLRPGASGIIDLEGLWERISCMIMLIP
jgi:hypothetical protein